MSSYQLSLVISILDLKLKTWGELNYFLGIEVRRYGSQLQLSQTKYTLDLLKRANFLLAKPCSSPVATGSKLSLNDSTPLVDATATVVLWELYNTLQLRDRT